MSERGKLCAQVEQTVQCSVLVERVFSTSSQGRLYVPYYLLMRFLDELCRNDSFSCWCIHFLLQLPVQHLVSRGLRAPVKAKPGWSVTRPIPFQLSNRCKHINIHTQKRSPLPSTANTHTHTHKQEYFTWCVVPSISTGTMKSALLIGWRENTEGEMVGMLIHMSRAVYIHMALHNSWTLRGRLHKSQRVAYTNRI